MTYQEISLPAYEVSEAIASLELLAKYPIKGHRFALMLNLAALKDLSRELGKVREKLEEEHLAKDEAGDFIRQTRPDGSESLQLEDPIAYREALAELLNEEELIRIRLIPEDALESTDAPASAFWLPMIAEYHELEE